MAARYWVPLLCVHTAGMLVHAVLLRGMVRLADIEQTLSLTGLGLTLLVTLVTFVIMFQLLRPGLPTIDAELRSEVVREDRRRGFAERERRVVDGVALAILPFLLFYAAWGLIREQYDMYSIALINTGGLEAFQAPLNVPWYGLPLFVAVSAWLLRKLCSHFYRKGYSAVLGVLTALFEGVWVFMFLFSLGLAINQAEAWMTGRVFWVEIQDALKGLTNGTGALIGRSDLYAQVPVWWATVWGAVSAGFVGPLLWLTIAAVVYRAQIDDHDGVFEEHRARDGFDRAVNRVARAGRFFDRFVRSDLKDQVYPCLHALRFVLRLGPVFYLSYSLCFVLLEVAFTQLHRLVFVLAGPGPLHAEWWPLLQPVDFVVDSLHMLLRVCLLAAAFEVALRKAEEDSVGRRARRVATHAPSPGSRHAG
ncbi:hypothetical protein [Nocardiopsis sp. CC223A]|uniref:hypothetical protein n=1 Tax=Nocardiopsis sp. CC223A TaxID=3044051 RepID=UPI00278C0114|nr:hypothetical protein [Nocardiopsis sp. CC223A]